ncbi:trypsin-like [Nasonia vitripennis]|uniref:Peptidase S1 domain-containing protein n=1 Tax=Nasonia vitripennis TaxID=7425 RepID=A0A7M7M1K9_NASVI|nr:trypsin-like [Nasonia vitripennis]
MRFSGVVLFVLGLTTSLVIEYVSARLDAEGIVGGTNAKPGQFKYQISLETEHDSRCGGGILDDHHVLTAAHCVTNFADNSFQEDLLIVLAGVTEAKIDESKSPSAVRVKVERIFIPKEYIGRNPKPGKPFRSVGDIAVLKLRDSLGLKDNPMLSKLQLPQPDDSYSAYDNEDAVIAGFGWNWVYMRENPLTHIEFEVGGASTDKLRFAEAKVIEYRKCKKSFYSPVYKKKHICAQVYQNGIYEPEGICSGDSGSPLVYNETTVIGVANSSPKGCREDVEPAVYARVSSHLDFIRNAMKGKKTSDMRSATFKRGFLLLRWFTDKKYAED